MKNNEFKEMLFDASCVMMACDGSIDKSEISKLKELAKTSTYFKNLNSDSRLQKFKDKVDIDLNKTVEEMIKQIKDSLLEPMQELILLEVLLIMVYADVKIHPNEIEFIQAIRDSLDIDDTTITNRFGEIDVLISKNEMKSIKKIKLEDVEYDNDLDSMYFGINPGNKDKK